MFYKLAAFASAVSALSIPQCDNFTMEGEMTLPGLENAKFEMNLCVDEDDNLVSGEFEMKNDSQIGCSINAGGNEDGFTMDCGEEDVVEAKFTELTEDGVAGEFSLDGEKASFTARPIQRQN